MEVGAPFVGVNVTPVQFMNRLVDDIRAFLSIVCIVTCEGRNQVREFTMKNDALLWGCRGRVELPSAQPRECRQAHSPEARSVDRVQSDARQTVESLEACERVLVP